MSKTLSFVNIYPGLYSLIASLPMTSAASSSYKSEVAVMMNVLPFDKLPPKTDYINLRDELVYYHIVLEGGKATFINTSSTPTTTTTSATAGGGGGSDGGYRSLTGQAANENASSCVDSPYVLTVLRQAEEGEMNDFKVQVHRLSHATSQLWRLNEDHKLISYVDPNVSNRIWLLDVFVKPTHITLLKQ